MRLGHLAMPILLGVITMTDGSNASPLDEFHWKNRVLVVVAPAGNAAAETQRRIYESSAKGMSERSIVLTEAADDRSGPGSPRTAGALRSFWSARTVTRPFLPTKPLSADDLLAQVDAMPMRRGR
jgi:Domain of unknown function (DUF4174)